MDNGSPSLGLRGRHHGRRPSAADPGHAGEAEDATSPRLAQPSSYDVAVVGGGVVGLAVAWRAARARAVACSCSSAASSAPGPRASPPGCSRRSPRPTPASAALLELGLRSARRWPAFAAELAEASRRRRRLPPVRHALSPATATRPRRSSASCDLRERARAARRARCCPARRAALEPALAPTLRARAATCPATTRVDPRAWSLRSRCARGRRERAGARAARPASTVDGIVAGGACRAEQVVRRRRRRGRARSARRARVRAPGQGPDPAPARPGGPGLLRARRALRQRRLPRPARRRRATCSARRMEERGFDTASPRSACYELLRDAAELVPGVLELEIEELLAGLRPGTPDNAPVRRRARSTGCAGRPGTTATASCWRRVTADLRRRAALAGEPRRPGASAAARDVGRFARGRGVIVLNGEPREPRRRDGRRAAGRPRRRAARPRRRGRGRRRGRPARPSGRRTASTTGAASRSLTAMQGG